MHRTYIADIERGARNVTLRTVAHLAKALQITIENLFAHATAPAGAGPRVGAPAAPTEVRNILLVDHEAADAVMAARSFKRAKLKIVRDGETGLDYLFGAGRYAKRKPARPQLILLGLHLPEMSGMEFLRRVKGDQRTCDIPVVVLTASE
jgi:CheY-like chemotaxis protein